MEERRFINLEDYCNFYSAKKLKFILRNSLGNYLFSKDFGDFPGGPMV